MRSRYSALILILMAFTLGCGSESVPAKTDLSEQDKAQINELNEQRTSEWGPAPKKK